MFPSNSCQIITSLVTCACKSSPSTENLRNARSYLVLARHKDISGEIQEVALVCQQHWGEAYSAHKKYSNSKILFELIFSALLSIPVFLQLSLCPIF